MLTVADVKDDVQRVLGGCDDETFYNRLNDIVEILSTEAEWDPLRGYMDVAVADDTKITLPRQVGQILKVNIADLPALGHDFWYKFHLNGPGTNASEIPGLHWIEELPVCTYVDVDSTDGNQLKLVLEDSTDNAVGKTLRVYGYDKDGNWVRSLESGAYVDGFLIPMNGTLSGSCPYFAKITRVKKSVTAGYVKLLKVNADLSTTTIGNYAPTETEPRYRRITLTQPAINQTVQIAFRKASDKFTALDDLIPLHSRYAIILTAKALKKFDEDRPEEGEVYQQKAIQLLTKKQMSVEIPSGPSVQIADGNLIASRRDRIDF